MAACSKRSPVDPNDTLSPDRSATEQSPRMSIGIRGLNDGPALQGGELFSLGHAKGVGGVGA